jgi:hypothetical protein
LTQSMIKWTFTAIRLGVDVHGRAQAAGFVPRWYVER